MRYSSCWCSGITLDGRSVSADIDAALSPVRLSPVSVAGFTLLRVAVQYRPAGLAVTSVWAARRAGVGGTPAFEVVLTDIDLSDPSVFLLVAAGLVVRQVPHPPHGRVLQARTRRRVKDPTAYRRCRVWWPGTVSVNEPLARRAQNIDTTGCDRRTAYTLPVTTPVVWNRIHGDRATADGFETS